MNNVCFHKVTALIGVKILKLNIQAKSLVPRSNYLGNVMKIEKISALLSQEIQIEYSSPRSIIRGNLTFQKRLKLSDSVTFFWEKSMILTNIQKSYSKTLEFKLLIDATRCLFLNALATDFAGAETKFNRESAVLYARRLSLIFIKFKASSS